MKEKKGVKGEWKSTGWHLSNDERSRETERREWETDKWERGVSKYVDGWMVYKRLGRIDEGSSQE